MHTQSYAPSWANLLPMFEGILGKMAAGTGEYLFLKAIRRPPAMSLCWKYVPRLFQACIQ